MSRYSTLTYMRGFDSCLVPSSYMLVIFFLVYIDFSLSASVEAQFRIDRIYISDFATLSKKKKKKIANEFIGLAMRFPWFFFFFQR